MTAPREVEDPCDKDGGACEWTCEDGMPDNEGGYEAWDLYCDKCGRWRDWGRDERGS